MVANSTDTSILYRCDSCGKGGNRKNGTLHCIICDYDICLNCMKDAGVILNDPPFCSKNHVMEEFQYSELTDLFTCNKCTKQIKASDGKWFCKQCKFNLCDMCNPLINFDAKKPAAQEEVYIPLKKPEPSKPLIQEESVVPLKPTFL